MNTKTTHISVGASLDNEFFTVHGHFRVKTWGWIFKKYRVTFFASYIAEGNRYGLSEWSTSRRFHEEEKTRSKSKLNYIMKDMVHKLAVKMAGARKFAIPPDILYAAVWWNITTGSDVPDSLEELESIKDVMVDFEKTPPKDL